MLSFEMTFASAFTSLLPAVSWVKNYRRSALSGDLTAGLTVGVMLIPQGMAYALIAGLPPVYGLYASLFPLVAYGLFGTSRQLAVGPVAMVSLLVAAGVAPVAGGDPFSYVGLAVLLSLMVGVVQFVLGMARFGFLVNFLSHPVLSGFTSAAALIIGLSQLKHLIGVDIPRSNFVHEIIGSAAAQIGAVNLPTLFVGLLSILSLVTLRRWKKAFPGALAVVAIGTVASWLLSLEQRGVAIVGSVPSGLPAFSAPSIEAEALTALLPTALTIALVGFMESIAVAKVYASRNRYEVDANQELIGLGLANIAGSFFRAYPTTGGFSRTAVNAAAGAKTNLAGIVSAGVIALTLFFLTPLFTYMPKAILAAIVMVAVAGLLNWKEALSLWRVDRRDFGLMLVTFAATLGLGIEEGILVGVVLSLVLVIQQSTYPHTAVLGRLPGTTIYRNLERHPEAVEDDGVLVIRMDASVFFANTAHLKDTVRREVDERGAVRAVVIDMYPVNRLDSTALHGIREIAEEMRERGIRLLLTGVKGFLFGKLERDGLATEIGAENFYMEVHDAVLAACEQTTESATQPA